MSTSTLIRPVHPDVALLVDAPSEMTPARAAWLTAVTGMPVTPDTRMAPRPRYTPPSPTERTAFARLLRTRGAVL